MNDIALAVCRMVDYRLDRNRQFRHLIQTCVDLTQTTGPCTLIRLTDFFTNGGDVFGKIHHLQVENTLYESFEPLWRQHIKSGCSPIDREISNIHSSENVDSGFFCFNKSYIDKYHNEKNIPSIFQRFKRLIVRSRIYELGFMWIKMPPSGRVWAVCLRRKKEDGYFSDYHKDAMLTLSCALHSTYHLWYSDVMDSMDISTKKNRDFFSEMQNRVLFYLSKHYTRTECAHQLCTSSSSIDKVCEEMYRKSKTYFNLNNKEAMTFSQLVKLIQPS